MSLVLPLCGLLLLLGCNGSKATDTEPDTADDTSSDVFGDFEATDETPSSQTRSDQDSDGIFDDADACPEVAGVASASHPDRHGCPVTGAEQPGSQQASAGPSATMIGFRDATSTSATVYVQVTEQSGIRQEQSGNVVTIHLSGLDVPRRNNKNPLVATHFDSVVESARLFASKGETRLQIVLRRPASVEPQFVVADGGTVLQVRVTAEAAAGN